MDIADTIAPKSDQINADDLIGGPQIITVVEVIVKGGDQPVDIITAETPGRAYRPNKSMRRLLIAAWGKQSSSYVGGRIELTRDPLVQWAGEPVGGIKITGLSRLDKPLKIALTAKRGQRKLHTVEPLPDATPARDWRAEANALNDMDALRALHAEAASSGANAEDLAHIVACGKRAKAASEKATEAAAIGGEQS